MEKIFAGSAIRTLRKMVKKGLIKVEDLDTPPDNYSPDKVNEGAMQEYEQQRNLLK